jgi:hypothetical protein
MTYLFSKLFVWLVLAFLFGLVMGFWSDVRTGESS